MEKRKIYLKEQILEGGNEKFKFLTPLPLNKINIQPIIPFKSRKGNILSLDFSLRNSIETEIRENLDETIEDETNRNEILLKSLENRDSFNIKKKYSYQKQKS